MIFTKTLDIAPPPLRYNPKLFYFLGETMSESSESTQNNTTTTRVIADGGNGGIFGLLLTLFLGPIGLFLSLWLLGKSLTKGIIYGAVFLVVLIICGVLTAVGIGLILLPIVWIIMLVIAYKNSKSPIDLEITTTSH